MSDFGPDTVLEPLGGMTFAESEEEIACTITRDGASISLQLADQN